MKISDLSPIFLLNIKKKVFCYSRHDKLNVVKLKCINPTKQLTKGEIYWGYEAEGNKGLGWNWISNMSYPQYKIFLPILGARNYDPKRFIVLDKMTIYKINFKYHEGIN